MGRRDRRALRGPAGRGGGRVRRRSRQSGRRAAAGSRAGDLPAMSRAGGEAAPRRARASGSKLPGRPRDGVSRGRPPRLVLGRIAQEFASVDSGIPMLEWLAGFSPVTQALIATTFTYLLTAVGTLPVLFFKSAPRRLMDAMMGFAAGVMVAASCWSLLVPAIDRGGVFAASMGLL